MTTDNLGFSAADHRRAAALVIHYLEGNAEGAAAIADEANESDGTTEMLLAVLDLMADTLTELRTPLGIRVVKSHLLNLAGMEDDQP